MRAQPTYTRAIVRPPAACFKDGVTEAGLGVPDFSKALRQHSEYCKALQAIGLEVISLPASDKFPDSCFVEDTAIIANGTAIITRLGHESRRGEEVEVEQVLARYKEIAHIKEPGSVDGGDVLRVGDQFFIGLTRRTNEEGARQLEFILKSCGMKVSIVKVEKFLHLKTAISGIDEDTVIALEEGLPAECRLKTQRQIIVPPAEHFAANCLSTSTCVVVPPDSPNALRALEELGKKVVTLDTSEFNKMDGRLTCLSILF